MRKKRFLTIILCLTMCLSLFPSVVFAEEGCEPYADETRSMVVEESSLPHEDISGENAAGEALNEQAEEAVIETEIGSPAEVTPSDPEQDPETDIPETVHEELPDSDEPSDVSTEPKRPADEQEGADTVFADVSEILTGEDSPAAEAEPVTPPAPDAEEGATAVLQAAETQLRTGSLPYYGALRYAPDAASNDHTLLDSYAAQQLGLIDLPSLMGPADPTAGFSPAQVRLFEVLSERIADTAAGRLLSTVYTVDIDTLGADCMTWTAADLGLSEITWDNFGDALDIILRKYLDFKPVHRALLYSLPYEFYWFDKTSFVSTIDIQPWYDADTGTVSILSLTYVFPVVNDYWNGDFQPIEYSDGSSASIHIGVKPVGANVTAAVSKIAKIVADASSYSDLDKLRFYKDQICTLVDYNHPAADEDWDYGNPWQLIWVFDDDTSTTVVCEGYSKAFEYLCDRSDFHSDLINCYIATGTMSTEFSSGGHMWNILTMDDGKNYLVDVTNCDTDSIGADELLFLKGCAETTDSGYRFLCNGMPVDYSYDDATISMYSADELRLSTSDYGTAVAATPFDLLKEACGVSYDQYYIEHNNSYYEYRVTDTDSLTIEENLTVPAYLNVFMTTSSASTVIVPAGVVLTVTGALDVSRLVIESGGRVVVSGSEGQIYLTDSLTIESGGSLEMSSQYGLFIEETAWDDALMSGIACSGGASVLILHTASSAGDLNALIASSPQEASIRHICEVRFDWTPEANVVVPGGMILRMFRQAGAALTIPEGKTFTVSEDASVEIIGTDLTIYGNLVNDGEIWLWGESPDGGAEPTVTVADSASCTGSGKAYFNGDEYEFISGADLFARLKAACESGTVHEFDLRNRGDFVIREDLTIPGNFDLQCWGTSFIVPGGVTLTVEGDFSPDNLRIEEGGSVIVGNGLDDAQLNVHQSIVLEGSVELNANSGASFPEVGMDRTARDRVTVAQDSWVTINYSADSAEQAYVDLELAAGLEEPFNGNVIIRFPWTLENSLTIRDRVSVYLDGAFDDGALIIPAGVTFTIESQLRAAGTIMTVRGSLVNNGRLELAAEEYGDNTALAAIAMDGGEYRGSGRLWVGTQTSPEAQLVNLDTARFDVTATDDGGTLYIDTASIFYAFKQACEEASEDNPGWFSLKELGRFVILESMTFPAYMGTDTWGTTVIVPENVVFTVENDLYLHNLELYGDIIAEETSYLNVGESLLLNGSITVHNTWCEIPVSAWSESLVSSGKLSFIGEDAGVNVSIPAYNTSDISNAPGLVQASEHVQPNIFVRFPWTAWTMSIDPRVSFHIQNEPFNEWNGSLTIPAGVTFTLDNCYLGLHNAKLTIQGTLINNGHMDVQVEDGGGSGILLDGGNYEGSGSIWVGTTVDPESLLGGLAEAYEFDIWEERGGMSFQLGLSFEWLKALCAEASANPDQLYEERIPNAGRFVIDESIVIPENLSLQAWDGELYVPADVVLTLDGPLNCAHLTVDGKLVITEESWLGVHQALNLNGTVTIAENAHMDLRWSLWDDSLNSSLVFDPDYSWVNLYRDVAAADDLSVALNDQQSLNTKEGIGKSLNVHFPLTLEDNFTVPEGIHLFIGRNDSSGSLTVPDGFRLTVLGSMELADADAFIYGTIENRGNINLRQDDRDTGYVGTLTLCEGGSYLGDGSISVRSSHDTDQHLIGFPDDLFKKEEYSDVTFYHHIHSYGDPSWYWNNDCTSATAIFVCTVCEQREFIEAEITSVPGSTEGSVVYTASAVFEGITYTDVREMILQKYSIRPSTLHIGVGKTAKIEVIDKETSQAVNYPGTLTWYSRNEEIVTVDANGTVTGKKAGFAWVTVTSASRDIDADCQVFVEFSDVAKSSDYFYNPVYWAVANGVTTGRTESTFDPYGQCTRGHIVLFLWRAMGQTEPSVSNPFADVKESDGFYKAVLWAVENGITTGQTPTTFGPWNYCTRGQIVTFLWRAMGKQEPTINNPFMDVSPGDGFYKAVLWAVENGITTGRTPTTFDPWATCTRGQAVTFLYRALNGSGTSLHIPH